MRDTQRDESDQEEPDRPSEAAGGSGRNFGSFQRVARRGIKNNRIQALTAMRAAR
jgi:hypothetical protein